jgi:Short C-terminal domain
MPFRPPRPLTQQDAYYRRLRDYSATRRVAPVTADSPALPAPDPVAHLKGLAELHDSGVLTDAEFATAKAKVLDAERTST